MGGAIAKKLLRETLGIEIMAYTVELGGLRARGFTEEQVRERYSNEVRCPAPTVADEMKRRAVEMRGRGASLGGGGGGTAGKLPVGRRGPGFGPLASAL